MATHTACPTVAEYERLTTSQLAEAERETLLEHLEGCDTCAQKFSMAPGPDKLLNLIHGAREDYVGAGEEAIARLVHRLSKLRPDETSAEAAQTKGPREALRSLPLLFACPACGRNLKIPGTYAGQKVQCPLCLKVVLAPAGAPITQVPTLSSDGLSSARTVPPEPRSPLNAGSQAGANAAAGAAKTVDPQPANAPNRDLCDCLAPPQAADELGRLGPYRVLEVLGAGGMGVVFRAEDPQLARPVALKAMLPGLAASKSARERFLREARSVAAIKHDHIVTIHQVGEDRGVPFLAMEFLEGEPLEDRLKREGKLPLAEVLRIGREMADGLAAAHERGLIHRDIKPANVWLEGKKGRVKILDFGLARAVTEEAHLTQSGAIVGTPAYMAPEQAQGKKVEPRTDLFSLGCVLYRMATGEPPFRGTDLFSILMAVGTENPAPPVSLNIELPAELSDFIMQLLAKKPEERPESAQAVAETLDRIAGGEQPPRAAKAGGRKEKAKVRAPGAGRRGHRFAVAVLSLALFASLGFWLSGIIIRVESKEGTLIIKTEDSSVSVKVTPEGGATVTYGKDRREIHLKPGKYGIELANAKDGLKLSTTHFTITSGDHRTVEVFWEKKLDAQGNTPQTLPDEIAAKKLQADWAAKLKLPVEATNKIGMKLRLIPPGDGVAKAFYLGKYEVTQGEWQQVMGYNPSDFGPKNAKVAGLDTNKFPVEQVSWYDSVEFCNKLSGGEGLNPYYELTVKKRVDRSVADAEVKILGGSGYHIPTDAEWEHGCRAGTKTKYHFGEKDMDSLEYAWFDINSEGRTHAVGEKKPNAFGLYDMHGNVFEWNEEMLTKAKTGAPERVSRGGTWNKPADKCAVSNRARDGPAARINRHGLRVARGAVGKESTPLVVEPTQGEKEAQKSQEEWAAKLKLPVEATNKIGMKLRLIPPGVGVAKAFYLGKYEVPQGEWEKVMGYNPSLFGPKNALVAELDTSKFPVQRVSWYDSVEFCNKLSERERMKPYYELTVTKRSGSSVAEAQVRILGGSGYHIPTDAEWEHGCRAGTKTKYHFGDKDEDLLEYAWFDKNSDGRTHPVGEKKPNAFGLYDMHGNVYEWNEEMLTNARTGAVERVNRSGNWANTADKCTVSYRIRNGPAALWNSHGLRVARAAVGIENTPSASAPLPHCSGWIEEKWLGDVAALPAAQQVAAVKAMMPQRNPGFEGTVKHQIVNGVVTEIQLDGSAVQDLSPLLVFAGLQTLDCSCKDPWQSPLADLSPLARLPLRSVHYPYHTWLGAEQLRSIKTLETINNQPVAAFWQKVDGEAAEFEIFCRLVAGLTPQEQVKAVAKRFIERNPGFDGKLNTLIEQGKFVAELRFPTDAVVDISPVLAFPGLQRLNLRTASGKVKLADLTALQGMKLTFLELGYFDQLRDLAPLKGMPLTSLNLFNCGQVRDLSPLQGMPLTSLNLFACVQVRDLTPLQGMPLTHLELAYCRQVQNLTPLKGMKLNHLGLSSSKIQDLTLLQGMPLTSLDLWGWAQLRDLTPLQGMKLTWLNLGSCRQVQDLMPLKRMPLTSLIIMGCDQVRDLTPLEGMALEVIHFDHKTIVKGMEGIRRMESMKQIIINDRDAKQQLSPKEFWKKYDAGEFAK